jgi:DNA-binding response OmpR family regulator
VIKVLMIEDNEKLLKVVCDFLKSEGYDVISAREGASGIKLAKTAKPDIILLDVMLLPGMNGYDVCRELRNMQVNVPIIFLTAKREETNKVLGLEIGADDYVTKPFGLKELNARIRSHLRRVQGLAAQSAVECYSFGAVTTDFTRYEIRRGKEIIPMSKLEAAIFKYLIAHKGEVVSREKLLNEIWGYEHFPTTRTIDNHVLNLRKKIEKNADRPQWLHTVHGIGYKFTG